MNTSGVRERFCIALAVVVSLSLDPQDVLLAQVLTPIKDICANPSGVPDLRLRFINQSREYIEQGEAADRVLDALECIAIEVGGYFAGDSALAAMFHLSDDDSDLRERLLRIAVDPRTEEMTRRGACHLIRNLAGDRETQQSLLRYVKDYWRAPGTIQVGELLKDLNNIEYLHFLEERVADPEENIGVKRLCERPIGEMKAAMTLEGALNLIQSGELHADRAWLLRQAARHGATKAQLRTAVLSFLRNHRDVAKRTGESSIAREIIAYDLFGNDDEREFPFVAGVRGTRTSANRGPHPLWATRCLGEDDKFFRRDVIRAQ